MKLEIYLKQKALLYKILFTHIPRGGMYVAETLIELWENYKIYSNSY